jgi:hypothetical protein
MKHRGRVVACLVAAALVVACGSNDNTGSPTRMADGSGGGGGSESNGDSSSDGLGRGDGAAKGTTPNGRGATDATTASDASGGDEASGHGSDSAGDACTKTSPLAFPGAVGPMHRVHLLGGIHQSACRFAHIGSQTDRICRFFSARWGPRVRACPPRDDVDVCG